MRHEPRRLGGARHRVPLVADAAGVKDQRIAIARPRRRCAEGRRDEARLAVGVIETPVGEEARLARTLARPKRPLERLERGVVRIGNIGERAEVEVPPVVVLRRGEAGVLAEDFARRAIGEGVAEAHALSDLTELPPVSTKRVVQREHLLHGRRDRKCRRGCLNNARE